ncbi:uncharacterized protein H6S33_003274 [Morchella sextelata]|uniref:uncharacterized protein n=1 Tax=Morchella sextelata TaxID=1174677 RepID=UPI001D052046|nr:uncharacterized protein H6S33_003274 [Morchella sextelata]KAH0607286.1 hypothetical protein H6S33_003274 [Morchella sextelata]
MPYVRQIKIQNDAEECFDAGDFDICLAMYHELCFLSKPTAKLHFNIGQLHLREGNLRESVSWFESAIRIDPFLAVAHFHVGSIYIRLGRFEEAREAYTRCYDVALRRGSISSAGDGTGDIDYDQIGVKYRLCRSDIQQNQRLCEGWVNTSLVMARPATSCAPVRLDKEERLVTVPEGLIFRVPEEIAKLARRMKAAETAEWRFRDEARVVAEVPSDSGRMGAWG